MKRYLSSLSALVVLLAFVGCSKTDAPAQAGAQSDTSDISATPDSSARSNARTEMPGSMDAAATSMANRAEDRRTPGLPGRTEELAQPDDASMVFLYYDLSGITPPIDAWIERDSRVSMAPPADKAAVRDQVRAELTAGLRSVERIGWLRMPLNADLSDYDPSYQEFTVRAFAPSSVFEIRALGEKVQLKFRNARAAQTWQVPADQAQLIRDKLRYSSATVDALLKIVEVRPAPGAGAILADVVEYEIRDSRGGQLIGRVDVAR